MAKKLLGKKVTKVVKVKGGKLKLSKPLKWSKHYTNRFSPYGSYAGFYHSGDTYTVKHDGSRNANVPMGFIRGGKINCNTRKKLGFSINASGIKKGKAYVTLRLWSGTKKYYEARRVITCGTWVNLYANLKKWKYRKKITRVDIVVSSEGEGWSDGASVSVRRLGTKK